MTSNPKWIIYSVLINGVSYMFLFSQLHIIQLACFFQKVNGHGRLCTIHRIRRNLSDVNLNVWKSHQLPIYVDDTYP